MTKINKKQRLLYILKFSLIALAGVYVIGKIVGSPELRKIKNIASAIDLQTGEEIDRDYQDRASVLGKPVYAELTIDYKPKDDSSSKDVYEELVAHFENTGWKRNKYSTEDDSYTGDLEYGYNKASAVNVVILIVEDNNTVKLVLTHR